jgi:hypothetical protein
MRSIERLAVSVAISVLIISPLLAGIFAEPLPTHFRTQGRLTAALDRPISASWIGSLRSLLRRLAHQSDLCILLDRRVDPDAEVKLATGERTLRAAIDEIARDAGVSLTRVGNCLVVAPPPAAARLRTLVALREREVDAGKTILLSDAISRLKTLRRTVGWADLDRPAEILVAIGRQFGLSITGIEQIPHDLWAGAVIPEATAAEAFSLVLNQFDLTFEWIDRGTGIRLVPIPRRAAIEKGYTVAGKSSQETLRILRARFEGLDAFVRERKLFVRGTIEEHDAVASALGLKKGVTGMAKRNPIVTIERQSFTLQAREVSLRNLLDELDKQGTPIRYDAGAIKKAGIDLNRKIALDFVDLPARVFFERLLGPFGLKFRITRDTVVVEPK